MEIVVITVRNIGGQAVRISINRHVHLEDGKWIGWHPDFYNGVDAKNTRAEDMFSSLETELAEFTKNLELLDEEIAKWTEQKKFDQMALETAKECESCFKFNQGLVLGLLEATRPWVVQKLKGQRSSIRVKAIEVGVNKEYAERHLKDVQWDFPRIVAYVLS